MLHVLTLAAIVASGGIVAAVSKSPHDAIPVCKPDDPIVFVSTAKHRIYGSATPVFKRNWKLAQAGKPTPDGHFACKSQAPTMLPASGEAPPHQSPGSN